MHGFNKFRNSFFHLRQTLDGCHFIVTMRGNDHSQTCSLPQVCASKALICNDRLVQTAGQKKAEFRTNDTSTLDNLFESTCHLFFVLLTLEHLGRQKKVHLLTQSTQEAPFHRFHCEAVGGFDLNNHDESSNDNKNQNKGSNSKKERKINMAC